MNPKGPLTSAPYPQTAFAGPRVFASSKIKSAKPHMVVVACIRAFVVRRDGPMPFSFVLYHRDRRAESLRSSSGEVIHLMSIGILSLCKYCCMDGHVHVVLMSFVRWCVVVLSRSRGCVCSGCVVALWSGCVMPLSCRSQILSVRAG